MPQALKGCFKRVFDVLWYISLERNICPPEVQTAGSWLGNLWSVCLATHSYCLMSFACFVFLISDMTCSQRSAAHSLQSRGGFLSSFLLQSKKGPARPAHPSGASPTQTSSVLLGKKEPTNHQVILNCVPWKVLSILGVNLHKHSTAPSFSFHLKKQNALSLLASVCWTWMQHKDSFCCLVLADAWFLFFLLFCSLNVT